MAVIRVGDRVGYSADFLANTGQQIGDAGFDRGTIEKLDSISEGLTLATVKWDGDSPPRVNVKNLAKVGTPGMSRN